MYVHMRGTCFVALSMQKRKCVVAVTTHYGGATFVRHECLIHSSHKPHFFSFSIKLIKT